MCITIDNQFRTHYHTYRDIYTPLESLFQVKTDVVDCGPSMKNPVPNFISCTSVTLLCNGITFSVIYENSLSRM